MTAKKNGVAYRVTVGKQKINEQDVSGMVLPWSEQDVFSIAPVMTGAGGGVGSFIAGALLITAAVVLAPVTGGASVGFLGATGTGFLSAAASIAIGNIGLSLVLGGVAQMLSPVPKPPGPAEAPTQLESNSFSGVLNTVRQGVPVPIAYGRVFVGSAVVSAGLDVDQV